MAFVTAFAFSALAAREIFAAPALGQIGNMNHAFDSSKNGHLDQSNPGGTRRVVLETRVKVYNYDTRLPLVGDTGFRV